MNDGPPDGSETMNHAQGPWILSCLKGHLMKGMDIDLSSYKSTSKLPGGTLPSEFSEFTKYSLFLYN